MNPIPDFDIADRMRKVLRHRDVTVQDAAARMGVSRNTIGSWINGHITPPPMARRLFAHEFDVDVDWLETGRHVEPEPEVDLSRIGESVMASCDHRDNATCLRCGLDWCHECDPGPAALCPVCHGRGYSTATWSPPAGAVVIAGTVRRV